MSLDDSASSSSSLTVVASPRQQQLLAVLEERAQLNRTQHILRLITKECFNKCVKQVGLNLSAQDKDCLNQCMDNMMMTHAYITHILSQ